MIIGFINKNYKSISAYTLAEMLIVLVIISVVLISLPPATKKLFRVNEVKAYHGRYECYWENDQLRYKYIQERPGQDPIIKEGNGNGDRCEFEPPQTYPYIMIHAVGGGGAGGNLTTAPSAPKQISAYTEFKPEPQSNWSKWFKSFNDKLVINSEKADYFGSDDEAKPVYSTMTTFRQVDLKYRKAGSPGKVSSMFFSNIPEGRTFYLYPGRGGAVQSESQNGEDGGNSVVQALTPNQTCNIGNLNDTCNLVVARGGKGATVMENNGPEINLVHSYQLKGGPQSDDGVSSYNDVKTRESGFVRIIDKMNQQENNRIASAVPDNAGNGGNGANHYYNANQAGFFLHEFDQYRFSQCIKQGGVTVDCGSIRSSYAKIIEQKVQPVQPGGGGTHPGTPTPAPGFSWHSSKILASFFPVVTGMAINMDYESLNLDNVYQRVHFSEQGMVSFVNMCNDNDSQQSTCKAGELGVNWVPINSYIENPRNIYGQYCENSDIYNKFNSGLWVKRSNINDISTQCVKDAEGEYTYCAVGDMKRWYGPEIGARVGSNCKNYCNDYDNNTNNLCACYAYNNASGALVFTHINNPNTTHFRNQKLSNGTFTIEQIIDPTAEFTYCQAQSNNFAYGNNNTPCASGGNFDNNKQTCTASPGGNGAIVILW